MASTRETLETILGPDNARKLMVALGGRFIRIPSPKGRTRRTHLRAQALQAIRSHSYREAAKLLNLPLASFQRLVNS